MDEVDDLPHLTYKIRKTALANGATLVTHNLRKFESVEGLQVEDWY